MAVGIIVYNIYENSTFLWFLTEIDHGRFAFDSSLDDRNASEISQNFTKRAYAVGNYLSEENLKYNDIQETINKDVEDKLRANGIDEGLAKHFGHKFSFRQLGPAKQIENVSYEGNRNRKFAEKFWPPLLSFIKFFYSNYILKWGKGWAWRASWKFEKQGRFNKASPANGPLMSHPLDTCHKLAEAFSLIFVWVRN